MHEWMITIITYIKQEIPQKQEKCPKRSNVACSRPRQIVTTVAFAVDFHNNVIRLICL